MKSNYAQPYVAGFDCGGTKSEVVLSDLSGHVFDTFYGGGLNVNSFGEEASQEHLKKLLNDVIAKAVSEEVPREEAILQMKGACVGAAGISNKATLDVIRRAFSGFGFSFEPRVVGDFVSAVYGAHGEGEGLILISGTGSVCCGMHNGKIERCGGFGHLIDDEGSAYAIGRDVLSLVVRSLDGRAEKTAITQEVFEKLKIDTVQELVAYVYAPSTGKREIAQMAPLVMTGIRKGEKDAQAILDKAAESLADLAVPVARKLTVESPRIAFCGSVLEKNELLRAQTQDAILKRLPKAQCVPGKADAAYGSVKICLEALLSGTFAQTSSRRAEICRNRNEEMK